jgi:hypothetical protein
MKRNSDRVGQVLLLLVGGGLILSGGSCAINVGANIFALLSLPFIGLGAWIVSLAMKDETGDEHQADSSKNTEKEKP